MAVWAGVAATIAAVGVGIWYYVRDDYPLQLTSTEITGLVVRAATSDGVVSGYIAHPPAELAQWVSSMEKDSSEATEPATTTVTIERSDGPALRLSIGGQQASASWIGPGGSATAPIGVQISQAFQWYLHGVTDALSNGGRMVPRRTPAGAGASPSPAASPSPSASPGGTP